ncbi:MAG: hypothetical protein ABGX04_10050 [Myxococcales bacterium]|nr:phospholipase [Myxococcales bacterium]HIK85974.1 phospholipase [Myxococcales bacterium]
MSESSNPAKGSAESGDSSSSVLSGGAGEVGEVGVDGVDGEAESRRTFGEAVGRLGPAVLGGLDALEKAFRHLHPAHFPELRAGLTPVRNALDEARDAFAEAPTPSSLDAFRGHLEESARLAAEALAGLIDPGPPEEGVMRAIQSMHQHARAQAEIYPLRDVLPPVSAFFAEPRFREGSSDAASDPDSPASLEAKEGSQERVGLFRSGEPGARGGFDLYVPESYDGSESWPLVVALHGGSGSGADFLWTWLREARCRRFLLLSPTSRDSTWSLQAPEIDGQVLRRTVEWVGSKWRVDAEHVLLTGLSDGATMTLLVGLAADSPFTHLAPISGVLHPMNFASGNLDRARKMPIYLVHGALDWLFPVTLAQEASRVLEDADAALVYREIEDLSHTYPREENARIIEWLVSDSS